MTGAFRRLLADRRGATALIVALSVPALMGAVGLAIDANLLFLQAHRLQIAADTAAYAASLLLGNTTTQANSPANYKTIATNAVAGITNGALIGTGLTVLATPAADFSSITVTLTSSQASLFAAVLDQGAFNISATAKAGAPPSTPCILALSTTASPAISVSNGSEITGSGCAVFANSGSSTALTVDGGGSITGKTIGTVGTAASPQNGGSYSPTPQSGQAAVAETSYSGIVIPSANYSTCTQTNFTLYGAGTVSPGVYCVSGTTTTTTIGGYTQAITMAAGTYYFVNSGLTFNSSTVTGTGVTFVFVGSTPGAIKWANAGAGNFTAATSGLFAGVFVYQACDPHSDLVTNVISAAGPVTFTGGIYMPCGELNMSNNASLATASGSTGKVEANQFVLSGAQNLDVTNTGGGPASPANVNLLQ